MALNIFLQMKANGADLPGDSTIGGREDLIEVTELVHEVTKAYDKDSGRIQGRRAVKPIKVIFPVPQSGPMIFKACVDNEEIEANFKFFRPNAQGMEEHFYTLELAGGRIVECKHVLPDTFDPEEANRPVMMEIELVAQVTTFRHEISTQEAQDDWSAARS